MKKYILLLAFVVFAGGALLSSQVAPEDLDTIWRPIDYIDPYNPALGYIPPAWKPGEDGGRKNHQIDDKQRESHKQITTPRMKGEGDTIREVVDTIPQVCDSKYGKIIYRYRPRPKK